MYSGVPLQEVSTMVEVLMTLANLQEEERQHILLSCVERVNTDTFASKILNVLYLPKVTEFHHPTFLQEYVLWFHVTMKNAMGV